MKFTGNKSTGDNLSFLKAAPECSESLGSKDCTSSTGYWLWNLEGNGVVSDDASKWTIQVVVQSHFKGYYRDANNNLQPFNCLASAWSPDGPRADYLQQPAGQKSIFFIDGPGLFHGTNPNNGCQLGSSPVDSVTDVFNFKATFSSNVTGFTQGAPYFVKIVVAPGGKLDTTNSIAGNGNISLNF